MLVKGLIGMALAIFPYQPGILPAAGVIESCSFSVWPRSAQFGPMSTSSIESVRLSFTGWISSALSAFVGTASRRGAVYC